MLNVPTGGDIYLGVDPVDMRGSFDRLSGIIQSQLNRNVLSDGLFVFRNKAGDKLKLIYWDRTGLVIVYKRLEKGCFKWPNKNAKRMLITRQELELLLDGINIATLKRLPELTFDTE